MLEASDIGPIDKRSPFLGSIANAFCENENKAGVSKDFIMYSALNSTLKSILTIPCWTEEQILKNTNLICEVKAAGTELFAKYQAFGTGTQKQIMLRLQGFCIERRGRS